MVAGGCVWGSPGRPLGLFPVKDENFTGKVYSPRLPNTRARGIAFMLQVCDTVALGPHVIWGVLVAYSPAESLTASVLTEVVWNTLRALMCNFTIKRVC